MKREQQSISKQLAAIEHEIKVRNTTFDEIIENLSLAFDLIEDCGRTYRCANDTIKKLMNQAIFSKIWIHEDGTVTTEFTDVYKNIAGPIERNLISQNTKSAPAGADADFIHKLLKSYSKFFGQGLNNELLVRLKGLEPPCLSTREPKSRMSTNSITGAYSDEKENMKAYCLSNRLLERATRLELATSTLARWRSTG